MDPSPAGNFAAYLLDGVQWDFLGEVPYASESEFEEAVGRCHQQELGHPEPGEEEVWQPEAIVLHSPRIGIDYYTDPIGEPGAYHYVELLSDEGQWFSAGHLLFKLHNATIGRLTDSGHHWFEGLVLERVTEAGVPVYSMIPGS